MPDRKSMMPQLGSIAFDSCASEVFVAFPIVDQIEECRFRYRPRFSSRRTVASLTPACWRRRLIIGANPKFSSEARAHLISFMRSVVDQQALDVS